MPNYRAAINGYLSSTRSVIAQLDAAEIDVVVDVLRAAYEEGRSILVMGNGGSGATASHIACDLNKGACFHAARKLKVIALTDNLPMILAIANDVGYDRIFVEQLKNFARRGDVVIGISASGNSVNVLNAIDYANRLGCRTIGMCGFDGGKLRHLVECPIHVRASDMQIVEDIHLMVGHILMRALRAGRPALGKSESNTHGG